MCSWSWQDAKFITSPLGAGFGTASIGDHQVCIYDADVSCQLAAISGSMVFLASSLGAN